MSDAAARQRLDKWLWYARVVKSRTLAQKLVTGGGVRVNGAKVHDADHRLTIGDTLTISVHDRLRVLEVLDPGTRRGPASEAATLYADHSPPLERPDRTALPATAYVPQRPKGAGRPTKKDRRQIDRFRDPKS